MRVCACAADFSGESHSLSLPLSLSCFATCLANLLHAVTAMAKRAHVKIARVSRADASVIHACLAYTVAAKTQFRPKIQSAASQTRTPTRILTEC